jgi:hypothetical protein
MHNALLPRLIAPTIGALRDVFPVTVVTGARQTGKSTLARQPELFGDATYLTLDDILIRDLARRDPELLLDRAERLVIDEVQHAPDLLLAIKRRVDERRVRGRYLLTGSSNLLLQRNVSESLAGRAGYCTLWPVSGQREPGPSCSRPTLRIGRRCWRTRRRPRSRGSRWCCVADTPLLRTSSREQTSEPGGSTVTRRRTWSAISVSSPP